MHLLTRVPFSGSMEPAFYRGDLLFLTNPVNEPYLVGDITVYKVSSRMPVIPIGYQDFLDTRRGYSHRAPSYREPLQVSSSIHLHIHTDAHARSRADAPLNQEILTKGDNNKFDDITLYKNMRWLERRHVVGKVRGCVLAFLVSIHYSPSTSFLPYVGYVTIAMVRLAFLFHLRRSSRSCRMTSHS